MMCNATCYAMWCDMISCDVMWYVMWWDMWCDVLCHSMSWGKLMVSSVIRVRQTSPLCSDSQLTDKMADFNDKAVMCMSQTTEAELHNYAITWAYLPHNWPFVSGIFRPPFNTVHRGPVVLSQSCIYLVQSSEPCTSCFPSLAISVRMSNLIQ